jgi:ribokinase
MTIPLVVLGSINLDYTVVVEHRPAPGETVLADTLVTATGGKGANQAVAAAAAGVRPVLLAAVGPDAAAAVEELQLKGVDLAHLQHTTTPTGIALITVGADGENTIVVAPGANAVLDAVAVAQHVRDLDPDVLLAQLEVPVDTVLAAARVARRFVLNYSPALPVPNELLELADPLIVNETEAAQLSAAPRSLVVTLGAAGARFVDADGEGSIPAPTVDVVDTTGAGDAFAGTLAAALVGGATLRDAVAAGVAAGSAAVRFVGAQPA